MWKDAWKDDHVNLYISSGSEAVILQTARPNREYTYHDRFLENVFVAIQTYLTTLLGSIAPSCCNVFFKEEITS